MRAAAARRVLCRLLPGRLSGIVGHILPFKDKFDRRLELLVVGVAIRITSRMCTSWLRGSVSAREVEHRIGLRIHREPILPIHLLAVSCKGRRQILVAPLRISSGTFFCRW